MQITPISKKYNTNFKPNLVDSNIIAVMVNGVMVHGNPHTRRVHDASKVYLDDVTTKGKVGDTMTFTGKLILTKHSLKTTTSWNILSFDLVDGKSI